MGRNGPQPMVIIITIIIIIIALLSPLPPCAAHGFLTQSAATQFLTRQRRTNTLFEESKKGNLERECIEELCNKEEAREIFENQPETEYFYPKYVACLGSHRVGINSPASGPGSLSDLRSCVKEISNQCTPLPCYKEGYERCIDGQASFTCVCKRGWKGPRCEEDVDECTDPEFSAGCSQKCLNLPGSFHCMCEDGYYVSEKIHCLDINECRLTPSICEPATCYNTPGMYECRCPTGYTFNFTSRSCQDVDECGQGVCKGMCVNTVGSFSCHCDGRLNLQLAQDGHSCTEIPVCVQLDEQKQAEMLYLGEEVPGLAVIYLHFRLLENTRFAAEFDFRTFDREGVILYAESSNDNWFMLGLRDGQIEVQFKNQHSVKVTSGGKVISNGQWHVISVEELERSISVKVSREAVMSINTPESLFSAVNGKLETKVYIAGLPSRNNSIIKPINPRLDGCIRGWNLMNQGASGVKEVIQDKKSKHCFVQVERGSYFPGEGFAKFNLNYSAGDTWEINVQLRIRPSGTTGVLVALATNTTVPMSLSVVSSDSDDAELKVFLEAVPVATLQSVFLCYPDPLIVELIVTPNSLQITGMSAQVTYVEPLVLQSALSTLDASMHTPVTTYLGGLPDLPVTATAVTAYYYGCMEVTINMHQLDLDEAVSKHNSIKSHSCPPVWNADKHITLQ